MKVAVEKVPPFVRRCKENNRCVVLAVNRLKRELQITAPK